MGLTPSLVVHEIGGDKRQAITPIGATFLQHDTDVGLALEIPCGRPQLVARGTRLA